jgi:predicted nucleic acid-binding protein
VPSIIVDANPLMAALLGGRAAQIFALAEVDLVTTETTIWEVRRYLPQLALKLNCDEPDLLAALGILPIRVIPGYRYRHALPTALTAIGQRDPKDAELLAVALALKLPIWSNDRDFDVAQGVVRFDTAAMVHRFLLPDEDTACH